MKVKLRVLGTVIALLLWASAAHAATYYVSTTGQQSPEVSCATAQNINTPKRTISSAAGCLAPGDTLLVRGGTYAEALEWHIDSFGGGTDWGSGKVRIAAYPGTQPYEVVWMRPTSGSRVIDLAGGHQYIEFDGINLDGELVTNDVAKINGVTGNAAHHIRFQNLTARGMTKCQAGVNTGCHMFIAAQLAVGLQGGNEFINLTLNRNPGFNGDDFSHGFYIQSADNIVDHCTIDGSQGWGGNGVQIFNGQAGVTTTPTNNTVKYCVMHDLAAGAAGRFRGVTTGAGSSNNKIYGNLIYRAGGTVNPSAAIAVEGSGQEIYNNTTPFNTRHGILPYAGTGHVVRNNVSFGNGVANYEITGVGTSATSSNNFGDTETGWSTLSTNPFVDSPNDNYRLQSGSAPINGGTNTSPIAALVTTDLDGTPRPQGTYDAGAYEFTSATSTAPTVTIQLPTTAASYTTTATELSGVEALSGIASDDVSVQSCSWSNSATGQSGATNGASSWNVPVIPLACSVANVITVTCLDGSANPGFDAITVFCSAQQQRFQLRIRRAQ